MAINPEKLSQAVLKKFDLEVDSKGTSLPIHRVRYWGETRKWGDTIIVEVTGCNEDCAICYVPQPLLRVDFKSEVYRKRLADLPVRLRRAPQVTKDVFEYAIKRLDDITGDHRGKVIELSSGEPTLYPWAIKRMAELCREEEVFLGVNTNGYLLAANEDYLELFRGLEPNMGFLVSIKGINPEGFEKYTGVRGSYYLTPFIAAQKIVAAGFEQPFLGVTVDTIAEPGKVEKDIDRLMELIGEFGLDLNKIVWDIVKEQAHGNWYPTVEKMIAAGYYTRRDGLVVRKTPKAEVIDLLTKKYGVDRSDIK